MQETSILTRKSYVQDTLVYLHTTHTRTFVYLHVSHTDDIVYLHLCYKCGHDLRNKVFTNHPLYDCSVIFGKPYPI